MKAILDVTHGHAYIQNADTNAYLEERMNSKQNTLAWLTDEDIAAMFAGTYEGTEDESNVISVVLYDGRFTKGAE